MKEVWMVEWSDNYADRNAAFSTREKAITYIQEEAARMKLDERGFTFVDEDDCSGEHTWGTYEFQPNLNYEDDIQTVWYRRFFIDLKP